jgi:nickel/cobalt transporter (NicO) family protein
VVAAIVAAAGLPAVAQAHPLGNFTVNRYTLIEPQPGHIRIVFVVDMAEIPTFQALGAGDASPAAAQAYARSHAPEWARRLRLEVNGRRLRLQVDAPGVAGTLRPGQAGLDILRVQVPALAAVPGRGPFAVTYDDAGFGSQVGWKEIVVHARSGAVLTRSSAATRDVSHMLRHYPAGLLQTPLTVSRATFDYRYGSGTSVTVAPHLPAGGVDVGTSEAGFTSLVSHGDLTPGFIALAILLAIGWGALHALSPGHGKSIVAAYLIGSRGTARHAAFLGATVTVTHTTGVFALGLVTLLLSNYIVPETLYPWLGVLSGVLVVLMGASILSGRISRAASPRHDHGHGHHHHCDAGHHHHHDHDHGHHHHGPGGHTHLPPGAGGEGVTARRLLALGISGGILPCPSAMVVMLGAIALHRIAFGLVLVLAFSLGLALTLTSVGILVVHARRLLERLPVRAGAVSRLIPVGSAAVITILGIGLTVQGLDTFPGGASGVATRLRADLGTAALAAGAAALCVALAIAVLRRRAGRVRAALVPAPTATRES